MKKNKGIVVVLAMLVFLSIACGKSANVADSSSSYSTPKVVFEAETNPEWIGSYDCEREYGMSDWGEWKSDVELFFDTNKKVGLGYEAKCVFRSDENHHWKKTVKEFTRTAYVLVKNK